MAGVHQLKKLAQSRGNNKKWVEYMPKHWSSYTLIFSVGSLLIFFFCFYDFKSSPTSLLRNASRELGGVLNLKAQVSDGSSIVSLPRISRGITPSDDLVTTTSDNYGKDKEDEFEKQVEDLVSLDTEIVAAENQQNSTESLVDTEIETAEDQQNSTESLVDTEIVTAEDQQNSTESSVDTPQTAAPSNSGRGKNGVSRSSVVESPADHERLEGPVHVDPKTISELDSLMKEGSRLTVLEDKAQRAGQRAAATALANAISDADAAAVRFQTCDFSRGKWVFDEEYPLYKPHGCPFVDGGFRCVENGRPSDEFQKWRWQPDECDLPKFNAKNILERLRGSRLAFVGDSIGRNNWESMLCMLAEGVENKSRIYEINGETISKHTGFLIYRFEDYDCTVEYYRSPYLVPQGRPAKGADPIVKTTLKLNEIDWSAGKWREADIIVFNSGHWWTFGKTLRSGNYFQEGQNVPLDMTVADAFREGMETVAEYVDNNINSSKSQVFFRSYAPVHFKGGTWDNGGRCNTETHPVLNVTRPYEDRSSNHMMLHVFSKNKKTPITFYNVTYLSDLRPDGHSSIWSNIPSTPYNRQDCSHWCLPGVPDTWNELLFANLLQNGKGKWAKKAMS